MIDDYGFIIDGAYSIHYEKVGEGPTIILIHGYGEDLSVWENVLPAFKSYEVIMVDLPGFGKSKKLPNYTLNAFAKVLIEWLAIHERKQYFVMGHSMGGYAALEFLAEAKNQLLGLGIIHSHPFGDSDETKENRNKRIEHIKNNGLKGYLKNFYPMLFAPKFVASNPELMDNMFEKGMSYGDTAFISGMAAMRDRKDRSHLLSKFKKPVLFIVGTLDAAIEHDQSMKQLSLGSISDVAILGDVGHMGMFEEPETLKKKMSSYLNLHTKLQSV